MLKKIKQFAVILLTAMFLLNTNVVLAITADNAGFAYQEDELQYVEKLELGTVDIRSVIMNIVNVFTSGLLLIFIVVILFGAYRLAKYHNSEAEIADGKKIMKIGLLCVVIVLVLYTIAFYIVESVIQSGGVY